MKTVRRSRKAKEEEFDDKIRPWVREWLMVNDIKDYRTNVMRMDAAVQISGLANSRGVWISGWEILHYIMRHYPLPEVYDA